MHIIFWSFLLYTVIRKTHHRPKIAHRPGVPLPKNNTFIFI